MTRIHSTTAKLRCRYGIGFKHEHAQQKQILESCPARAWFEVHPENDMVDGIAQSHLHKLKILVDRYQPEQVSEHLSWSHWQNTFLNDLLPLPLTQESFAMVCRNIQHVQEALGRAILIENPLTYLTFEYNEYSEIEFLNAVCQTTGCGLLLDINNIIVSSSNNHANPGAYLETLSFEHVREMHLAGHTQHEPSTGATLLIDDHGSTVGDATWQLYEQALIKLGCRLGFFPLHGALGGR